MVDRLQEPLRGVIIVDLDGTLLTVNSMHIFMRRLPVLLMKRRAIGAAIGCYRQMALRALRLISHRSMKWHLTKLARFYLTGEDWERLAGEMAAKVNTVVCDYISTRRDKGCLTYIATAAVSEYTLPLCRMLGYDGVLSTQFTENKSSYKELKRHAKHIAIEKLLESEHLRLESFLTDHADDLPTAKAYPELTIVVGASLKTADTFRKTGVSNFINRRPE